MYIFGGRTEEGTDLGDLAAFRITTRRWYTFQNMGPSPSPRSGHSMTAFGKQIVVLAGEPSSAPRDAAELSLVYILDTGKIRYPNDQQIQQTPAGERVPGNRRPSQDRAGSQQRGLITANGAPEGPNRKVYRKTLEFSTDNLQVQQWARAHKGLRLSLSLVAKNQQVDRLRLVMVSVSLEHQWRSNHLAHLRLNKRLHQDLTASNSQAVGQEVEHLHGMDADTDRLTTKVARPSKAVKAS